MEQVKTKQTWVLLQMEPLHMESALEFLKTPTSGAVDLFVGTTRRWTGTKETRSLVYDCYVPMALKEMNRLVEVASEKWPVSRAIVHHRLGTVEVCEISVIIGISTAHRKDAFEACRWLIDSLKNDVPIWKKEVYADGTEIWIEKTEN